jgi:hypothetical protein
LHPTTADEREDQPTTAGALFEFDDERRGERMDRGRYFRVVGACVVLW